MFGMQFNIMNKAFADQLKIRGDFKNTNEFNCYIHEIYRLFRSELLNYIVHDRFYKMTEVWEEYADLLSKFINEVIKLNERFV
jgi:hypothetical protein